MLNQKLLRDVLYGLGTVSCDRKSMFKMKKDKEMNKADFQCKFYKSIYYITIITIIIITLFFISKRHKDTI